MNSDLSLGCDHRSKIEVKNFSFLFRVASPLAHANCAIAAHAGLSQVQVLRGWVTRQQNRHFISLHLLVAAIHSSAEAPSTVTKRTRWQWRRSLSEMQRRANSPQSAIFMEFGDARRFFRTPFLTVVLPPWSFQSSLCRLAPLARNSKATSL